MGEELASLIAEAPKPFSGVEFGLAARRFVMTRLRTNGGAQMGPFLAHLESSTPIRAMAFHPLFVWLQHAMDGDDKGAALAAALGTGPKTVCGKVLRPTDIAYRCEDCGADPTCIMCVDCFKNSPCVNHNYKLIRSGGGMCDCGDPTAWKPSSFCLCHRGADDTVDPTSFVPAAAKAWVSAVIVSAVRLLTAAALCAHAHEPSNEKTRLNAMAELLLHRLDEIVHTPSGKRLVARALASPAALGMLPPEVSGGDSDGSDLPSWSVLKATLYGARSSGPAAASAAASASPAPTPPTCFEVFWRLELSTRPMSTDWRQRVAAAVNALVAQLMSDVEWKSFYARCLCSLAERVAVIGSGAARSLGSNAVQVLTVPGVVAEMMQPQCHPSVAERLLCGSLFNLAWLHHPELPPDVSSTPDGKVLVRPGERSTNASYATMAHNLRYAAVATAEVTTALVLSRPLLRALSFVFQSLHLAGFVWRNPKGKAYHVGGNWEFSERRTMALVVERMRRVAAACLEGDARRFASSRVELQNEAGWDLWRARREISLSADIAFWLREAESQQQKKAKRAKPETRSGSNAELGGDEDNEESEEVEESVESDIEDTGTQTGAEGGVEGAAGVSTPVHRHDRLMSSAALMARIVERCSLAPQSSDSALLLDPPSGGAAASSGGDAANNDFTPAESQRRSFADAPPRDQVTTYFRNVAAIVMEHIADVAAVLPKGPWVAKRSVFPVYCVLTAPAVAGAAGVSSSDEAKDEESRCPTHGVSFDLPLIRFMSLVARAFVQVLGAADATASDIQALFGISAGASMMTAEGVAAARALSDAVDMPLMEFVVDAQVQEQLWKRAFMDVPRRCELWRVFAATTIEADLHFLQLACTAVGAVPLAYQMLDRYSFVPAKDRHNRKALPVGYSAFLLLVLQLVCNNARSGADDRPLPATLLAVNNDATQRTDRGLLSTVLHTLATTPCSFSMLRQVASKNVGDDDEHDGATHGDVAAGAGSHAPSLDEQLTSLLAVIANVSRSAQGNVYTLKHAPDLWGAVSPYFARWSPTELHKARTQFRTQVSTLKQQKDKGTASQEQSGAPTAAAKSAIALPTARLAPHGAAFAAALPALLHAAPTQAVALATVLAVATKTLDVDTAALLRAVDVFHLCWMHVRRVYGTRAAAESGDAGHGRRLVAIRWELYEADQAATSVQPHTMHVASGSVGLLPVSLPPPVAGGAPMAGATAFHRNLLSSYASLSLGAVGCSQVLPLAPLSSATPTTATTTSGGKQPAVQPITGIAALKAAHAVMFASTIVELREAAWKAAEVIAAVEAYSSGAPPPPSCDDEADGANAAAAPTDAEAAAEERRRKAKEKQLAMLAKMRQRQESAAAAMEATAPTAATTTTTVTSVPESGPSTAASAATTTASRERVGSASAAAAASASATAAPALLHRGAERYTAGLQCCYCSKPQDATKGPLQLFVHVATSATLRQIDDAVAQQEAASIAARCAATSSEDPLAKAAAAAAEAASASDAVAAKRRARERRLEKLASRKADAAAARLRGGEDDRESDNDDDDVAVQVGNEEAEEEDNDEEGGAGSDLSSDASDNDQAASGPAPIPAPAAPPQRPSLDAPYDGTLTSHILSCGHAAHSMCLAKQRAFQARLLGVASIEDLLMGGRGFRGMYYLHGHEVACPLCTRTARGLCPGGSTGLGTDESAREFAEMCHEAVIGFGRVSDRSALRPAPDVVSPAALALAVVASLADSCRVVVEAAKVGQALLWRQFLALDAAFRSLERLPLAPADRATLVATRREWEVQAERRSAPPASAAPSKPVSGAGQHTGAGVSLLLLGAFLDRGELASASRGPGGRGDRSRGTSANRLPSLVSWEAQAAATTAEAVLRTALAAAVETCERVAAVFGCDAGALAGAVAAAVGVEGGAASSASAASAPSASAERVPRSALRAALASLLSQQLLLAIVKMVTTGFALPSQELSGEEVGDDSPFTEIRFPATPGGAASVSATAVAAEATAARAHAELEGSAAMLGELVTCLYHAASFVVGAGVSGAVRTAVLGPAAATQSELSVLLGAVAHRVAARNVAAGAGVPRIVPCGGSTVGVADQDEAYRWLIQRCLRIPETYSAVVMALTATPGSPVTVAGARPPQKPVLCLACRGTLALQSTSSPQLFSHARTCGGGTALFLCVKNNALLVLQTVNYRASQTDTPYVDKHGEPDIGMRRGVPLRLNVELTRALLLRWLTCSWDHDTALMRHSWRTQLEGL